MRFPMLAEETMNEEQKRVAKSIADGPRGGVRGPFLPLLYDASLAERVQGLGQYVRYENGLPQSINEMAVLITARHWDCAYEWAAHAPLAQKAGLSPTVIEPLGEGKRPPAMTEEERIAYEFCTEILRSKQVSEPTFDAAKATFGLRGALNLTAVCGYYGMLALVLNTAAIPLPAGAPRLPDLR